MLTLIIAIVIGIIIGIGIDEGLGNFVMSVLVCILIGLFVGGVLLEPEFDSSKTTVRYEKIIPVNGYYVDPKGNWVTESNERGYVNLPIALPVDRINGDLYIEFKSQTRQKSIWSLVSGHTENSEALMLAKGETK